MKTKTIYGIFSFLLVITLSLLLVGYSNGPAATVGMGYTGAPGESGMLCANCHSGNNYGEIEIIMDGTYGYEFHPYEPNIFNFTIANFGLLPPPTGFGFQLYIVDESGLQIPVTVSPNAKLVTTNSGTYVEHDGISSSNEFSIEFVLDGLNSDVPIFIYIYVTATVVNGDGTNGGDSGSESYFFTIKNGFVDFIPVTLTDFTATPLPTNIRLDWTTETEQDNDYFAVEHSTDGVDFSNLKTITGAGTTDERHTYTYTHANPVDGSNYYRLRQVDFDGKETFSEIVSAKFIGKFDEITVFPQPASSEATIYLHSSANESGTMKVYDINGKRIHSNNIQLVEGGNYLNLNCENWIAGHYVVHIRSAKLGEEMIHFLKK